MWIDILRVALAITVAFICGKLAAKLRLPAILGWLIAGMVLGPHLLGVLSPTILNAPWFESMVHVLECAVGIMIGSELVWKTIKRSGNQIIVTTLTESLGTFLIVTAAFGIIFWIQGVPFYLAAIFGAIALATAPAPSLSIVREFRADGPVARTLIPMAALDDIVGVVVFFTVISAVSIHLSALAMPVWLVALAPVLPLLIGAAVGVPAGFIMKKVQSRTAALAAMLGFLLLAAGVGFFFNLVVMPQPIVNFMLIGMAFSAAFTNIVPQARLDEVLERFDPVLGVALLVAILNLGAPLDYRLIFGAGLFTAIYILSRAIGKCGGAWVGAKATKAPPSVTKYLGLTLLPHSGVSLVFTGIAVSTIAAPAPEEAKILQGTIAAAAVINELIAVLLAKKGFEWAGELGQSGVRPDLQE